MKRRLALLAAGALALCLAACSSQLSWPDQTNLLGNGSIALSSDTSVGQTFVALEAGLSGIDVYLTPQGALQGDIGLDLEPPPQTPSAGTAIVTASLPASAVLAPGYYHFSFPPQADSRLRSYYFQLSYHGAGQLSIGHGPPDSYQQGALYLNAGPDDAAQMAFRLTYASSLVTSNIAGQALTWLGWLLLAGLLFVVPGWALLVWLWPNLGTLSWGEQLGLATGLGVALYPILVLWTSLVGLRLGGLYAVLPAGLGLAALAVWLGRRMRQARLDLRRLIPDRGHWAPDLALVGVTGLVFFTRLWAVRNLPAPMWGDSLQHTLITQLIVDHGGLFSSWAPYADLQTFTYHFGFHTLAAAFHWATGLANSDAVLWTGQILNCAAVLALYPLAVRVSRQRWAGVGAVLVAGLLSSAPMIYADWGRYTQLAGQVVLPAAITLSWVVLEDGLVSRGAVVLAGLALGGLALSHYRILIFAVIFFAAFALMYFGAFRRSLRQFVAMGLIGGVIFLPWFIRVFGGQILALYARVATIMPSSTAIADTNVVAGLDLYPAWLWLVAGLALAAGLWQRERRLALLGLWCGLVVLAANPQWLRLPGQGILTNFTVIVLAYLPLAVAAGSVLAWLVAGWPRLASPILLVLVLVAGAWGARQRLADVQPGQFALVAWPDLRAAQWIQANTPPDARFLVNSFFAYGGTVSVGSDAGWWLPMLAHRSSTLPPINYVFEQGNRPNYQQWVNDLPHAIADHGVTDGSVAQLLRDRGVSYVYLGQLRGQVNNPGVPALDAGTLLASPMFQLVYHQDRVFIFRVVR